jgi:hypothetical protein
MGRDARMAWWREARFGMFVHFGLYSPAGGFWDGKRYVSARSTHPGSYVA